MNILIIQFKARFVTISAELLPKGMLAPAVRLKNSPIGVLMLLSNI